jgi:NADH-quinone oxidoreductase subunit C
MAIPQQHILDVVRPVLGDTELIEHHGQFTLVVERDNLLDTLRELRDHRYTKFEQLLDITAIDWLKKKTHRFEVVYFLYSLTHADRLRVKVQLSEKDAHVASVCSLWESANWYERECYDMYGIFFDGHPDLRRFYMPEDYIDPETKEPLYPLRKDYPLMGVPGAAFIPEFPEKNTWKKEKEEYLKDYPNNPLDTSYTMN